MTGSSLEEKALALEAKNREFKSLLPDKKCIECGGSMFSGSVSRCRRCYLDRSKVSRQNKLLKANTARNSKAQQRYERELMLEAIPNLRNSHKFISFTELKNLFKWERLWVDPTWFDVYQYQRSPDEELMIKEDWEEEEKYLKWRSHRNIPLFICTPRWKRTVSSHLNQVASTTA